MADFGNYLIKLVRPLYTDSPIPTIDLENEIFALDSTTLSVSINLFTWAAGKYSRGAVKIHTLIDLRGSISEFILITDGKYHDSNAPDVISFYSNAIYLKDKAYVDFEALFRINNAGAFFVTRAKETMRYTVVERNFNIDKTTGLRADKTEELTVVKSKRQYPQTLRLVEFYDDENNEMLVFLTNNFVVSALEVARLYQQRWQNMSIINAPAVISIENYQNIVSLSLSDESDTGSGGDRPTRNSLTEWNVEKEDKISSAHFSYSGRLCLKKRIA